MAEVAIIVPMLHRAHRVAPLLESIAATTLSYRVVFACTPTDQAVIDTVDNLGAERVLVPRQGHGDYARKIQVGIDVTDEEHIFTGADDLRFHPHWFERAMERMTPHVGVVGTNDMGSPRVLRGEHATHFLVARWYAELGTIDQPRQLFHDGYPHEFVDDELVATAKWRNAWAFAPDSFVEHLHPNWGKAPTDDLYDQQGLRIRMGRKLYRRRQRLWM